MQEHKRVKHGHMPGDVSKQAKIRMREGKGNFFLFPWQHINDKCAKAFRKIILDKGRTVQRRRDKTTIDAALEDYDQT